jgi:hypothetical protein
MERSAIRVRPQAALAAPTPNFASRVEDGRGCLGHKASLRLPSPLIKPDVRISRIRLSDWLRHAAVGGAPRLRLRFVIELSRQRLDVTGCCQAHRQSHPSSAASKAHQKSGSFPPLALPSLSSTMTLSDARRDHPPSLRASPDYPVHPSDMPCPLTPMDRNGCVCRLLPHSMRAFPVERAGRRP